MKRSSSNDIALSMACGSSFPPNGISSAPAQTVIPDRTVMNPKDRVSLRYPNTKNPQDSTAVPKRPEVLEGNQESTIYSPTLGGKQIHARGPRRCPTPPYYHVPPAQLELLLDNAASLTEMLQGMTPVRRRV